MIASITKLKNVGYFDQILRTGISLAMVYYGFFDHSLIQDGFSATIVGVLGVLLLVVAVVGYCPLYSIAGINTAHCSKE